MKSTKKALFMSCLSLLLCVSMLVGTTFAWFTDSVTSGVNQIIAGNLDVELKYSKDMSTWNTVEEATDLFSDVTLWEPGATSVVYLKVENKGTLALKYKLAVTVGEETGSVNVTGDNFKLSDYIQFGQEVDVTAPYADREAAVAAVSADAKPIKEGYQKDNVMYKDAADQVVALVVYMPTTVGNEANYRTGEAVPIIKMNISVVAAQLNKERDSFDDTYDMNAPYPDGATSPIINVGSAETLKAAIEQFTAGTTVVLECDIDLQNELWDVSVPFSASGTEVIFDGGGHTIKNLKTNGEYGGLFGKFNSNGNIIIKNLTLENVDLTGTNQDGEGSGGALIGWTENHGGTLTINNVHAKNVNIKDFKYIGGLIGYSSAPRELTIVNCSVNGGTLNSTYNESGNYKGHVAGIIGYINHGSVSGCSASNLTILGSTTANRAGALIGTAQANVVVGTGNSVHSVTINGTAVTAENQIIGSVDSRTDKSYGAPTID